MKSLYETFTDQEFASLLRSKKQSEKNWHDFIMTLANLPKISLVGKSETGLVLIEGASTILKDLPNVEERVIGN